MRVEWKDAHGNAIDFTGLLQMGETLRSREEIAWIVFTCVKEAMKMPTWMSTKRRRLFYQGFAEGEYRKARRC
jgi:hypothetical protein